MITLPLAFGCILLPIFFGYVFIGVLFWTLMHWIDSHFWREEDVPFFMFLWPIIMLVIVCGILWNIRPLLSRIRRKLSFNVKLGPWTLWTGRQPKDK